MKCCHYALIGYGAKNFDSEMYPMKLEKNLRLDTYLHFCKSANSYVILPE